MLEFYNSGKLPLALRPGMPIGALSFEPLSGPAARPYNRREDAKYRDQQGAVASRIDKDNVRPVAEGAMRRFLTTLMILLAVWWPGYLRWYCWSIRTIFAPIWCMSGCTQRLSIELDGPLRWHVWPQLSILSADECLSPPGRKPKPW